MLNLNGLNESLSAMRRGFSWLALPCVAVLSLALMTGCPPMSPNGNGNGNGNDNVPTDCTEDSDCDDGDFCTGTETCVDSACVAGTDPCPANEECNEETNACDPITCTDDAGCDDGAFCNGSETCVDGTCTAGTDECAEGQTCNEETDTCEGDTTCDDDADCDDGAFCNGAEVCTAGACLPGTDPCADGETCDEATDMCVEDEPDCTVDADCDDGDFCNGDETCVDGSCVDGTSPCDDGETCDEDTDTCTPDGCESDDDCEDGETCDVETGECEPVVGPACTTDDDCEDDGLFCTGDEVCVDGFCESEGDPCDVDAGETCNEGLNACDEAPVVLLSFTLAADDLDGTDGDDFFSGVLLFNAPTGTNVPSVQTGDAANGGDGDDSLVGQFNLATAGTVAPTFTSIEALTFTDFGTAATTLAGTGITGATSLDLVNSTNTNVFTVTNLPNLVDLGISQQAIGATLSFVVAASSGATDSATLSFNGFNATGAAGTVTYTTGNTNGLETLNIEATGNGSRFQDIAMNGTSLTTVNVSGDADLEILTSFDANVTTINASTATGDTILTHTNAATVTYTGGAGDDTFTLGGTYATTDIVNGGAGTNTLGVDSATAATAGSTTQSNVTNFQALAITDGLAGAVTPASFGAGVTMTNLLVGFNGGSLTVLSGSTITSGTRAADSDSAGAGTVTVNGSGISDVVNYTVNDSDHAAGVTFTGVETLNLQSNGDLDGSAADGGANTFTTLTMTPAAGTDNVVITGAANLTFTGAVTAEVLNATAFTGNLVMSATSVGTTSITGGSGNDTLFGTTGADTLSGLGGNDTFNGQAGADIVVTGAGNDIVAMVVADVGDTITDFTVGTDKFDWNTALSSTDASVTTPGAATAFQSAAAGTAIAVTTTVFELTGTTVATQSAANLVTALGATATNADTDANILFIVYTTGGGGAIWNWINADANVEAAELTLVATFSTLTADSLGATDFQ